MAMLRSHDGQLCTLGRAFLKRFFENDVTGNTDDLKTSFFWLLAFLAVPGFLMPLMVAFGWDLTARIRGVEVLREISRGDKAFYLGFAMTAAAAITAVAWHSLLVDRRDGLILGALPVQPAVIVGAKLAALGAYVALVAVAMHSLAALSFGMFLASRNTFGFAFRNILAHFLASTAASAAVMFAVSGTQGIALAILGPRLFARVSPGLQMILVALAALGFLTLPVIDASVVDTLRAAGPNARPWLLSTPPLWFLGLYERIIGTGDPVLLDLSRRALLTLLVAGTATLVSFPAAYRRTMRSAVEDSGAVARPGATTRLANVLIGVIARRAESRAVAQFFLATLGRVERHRFVMAMSAGLAAVWGLSTWVSLVSMRPAEPSARVLALSFSTVLFLLVGLRVAASLPGDRGASWLFDLAQPPGRRSRAVLERLMMALVIVPVVVILGSIVAWLWGTRVALEHSLVVIAMGLLLIQVLLWRYADTPCARAWSPSGESFGRWWLAYVLGFAVFTSGVPRVERWLFDVLYGIAAFAAGVLIIALGLRAVGSRQVDPVTDSEESAPGELLSLN